MPRTACKYYCSLFLFSISQNQGGFLIHIKDIPKAQRPREKLLASGSQFLTNAELLSIIFGTGTRKQDVKEIAEEIFPVYQNEIIDYSLTPEELSHNLHIPLLYACKLKAFFELGRRYFIDNEQVYIHSPLTAYTHLKYMQHYTKEYLIGIYLNTRNKVIHKEVISIGTVNSSLLRPKEVLEPAIAYNAVTVIVSHNHPSGDPTPSEEDITATKKLDQATQMMGMVLLDHIIIGKDVFFSCKEAAIM